MADLFSGLEDFGLGNLSGIDVYEKINKADDSNTKKAVKNEVQEKDIIYDKNFTCPVCNTEFKVKTIKAGKLKLISSDLDLRPKYQLVDPLKYDSIVCPHCGYAALRRYFSNITGTQASMILKNISAAFRGLKDTGEILSYDDAIAWHKLALVSAIVKKASISERAYICLKTAWLIRGKSENLDMSSTENQNIEYKLKKEEAEFILKAYDGFTEAFTKESFPMCGMDEYTITLLMAELARRTGNIDDSYRLLSKIIMSRDCNDRIKDRAREIKELIRNKD